MLRVAVLSWITIVCSYTVYAASTTVHKEERWLDQASLLIQEAKSSRAVAKQFNKDVRDSRVQLREIVQKTPKTNLSTEHRALHSTMVLLDVLLKSAAACQTAGHIVCPPLLMSQLNTVMKNAYTNLDRVKHNLD